MKKMKLIMAMVVFLGGFATGETLAQAVVKVRPARPKTVVVKPVAPRRGMVWMDGHWRWQKRGKRYVWVKGSWVAPVKGKTWRPGRWNKKRGGWVYVPGRWV